MAHHRAPPASLRRGQAGPAGLARPWPHPHRRLSSCVFSPRSCQESAWFRAHNPFSAAAARLRSPRRPQRSSRCGDKLPYCLGVLRRELEEAEADPAGGEMVADQLQRKRVNLSQFGAPTKAAGDDRARLRLLSGDHSDDRDRLKAIAVGVAGLRRKTSSRSPAAIRSAGARLPWLAMMKPSSRPRRAWSREATTTQVRAPVVLVVATSRLQVCPRAKGTAQPVPPSCLQ